MKKFSRCALIFILVAIISGVAGYFYFDQTTIPMYTSTTRLYVVPGVNGEASIRAKDGGLNDDFMIIFKSNVVISAAQSRLGTSEDIAQYLTVTSPADSNIVEITCVNPDQNTAKKYVDAVAATAIKTTSIIPVESIQILSEGTADGQAVKLDVYWNTAKLTSAILAGVLFVEILVLLFIGAFKKKEDNDDELEYERRFGRYAAAIEMHSPSEVKQTVHYAMTDNSMDAENDDVDILAGIEDSYEDEDIAPIQEDAAQAENSEQIEKEAAATAEQQQEEPVSSVIEPEVEEEPVASTKILGKIRK